MQILKIKSRNIKGIVYAEVKPKGITIVGGANAQGKTSFLDTIAAALGGTKLCPKRPIKDGEDEAIAQVTLSACESKLIPEIEVTRRFKRRHKDGQEVITSDLKITSTGDDPYDMASPQKTLDELIGKLGFDPEAFLREKPEVQADIMRELVNLDFEEIDKTIAEAENNRTIVGREVRSLEAQVNGIPVHQAIPTEEISVNALVQELEEAQQHNQNNRTEREMIDKSKNQITSLEQQIQQTQQRIAELNAQLQNQQNELAGCEKDLQARQKRVAKLEDKDESIIRQSMKEADETNRKVREKKKRMELDQQHKDTKGQYESYTRTIESLRKKKQDLLTSAQWPVPGISLEPDDRNKYLVTYHGIPLEQTSAKEQRAIAVAIGAARNPELKFMLIRDGALLDENALIEIAGLAAQHNCQLFIERVGDGSECDIVIEGGEITRLAYECKPD